MNFKYLFNSLLAWYDDSVGRYQEERLNTDLDKVFEEKLNPNERLVWHKRVSEEERKRLQDKLNKENAGAKEGEEKKKRKIIYKKQSVPTSTTTQSEFQQEESKIPKPKQIKIEKADQKTSQTQLIQKPQQPKIIKAPQQKQEIKDIDASAKTIDGSAKTIDASAKIIDGSTKIIDDSTKTIDASTKTIPTSPLAESTIYGKELVVETQKQIQKEEKDNYDVTRLIKTQETLEQEHKSTIKEIRATGKEGQMEPPVFTKKIEPLMAIENSEVVFQCNFTGLPTPQITWYKENVPILSSNNYLVSI